MLLFLSVQHKISRARGVTPPLYVCVTSARVTPAPFPAPRRGPRVQRNPICCPPNCKSLLQVFWGGLGVSGFRPKNAGQTRQMQVTWDLCVCVCLSVCLSVHLWSFCSSWRATEFKKSVAFSLELFHSRAMALPAL